MTKPVINIFRTLPEALSVKNSQVNRFYKNFGVQLLPNNPYPYIQVTDTPLGLHLEDWTVMAVSLCKGTQINLTSYFMVESRTNSDNGNPQIIWSLTNVPIDLGINPIYLKITQAVGETFYTQPFLLTAYAKEKTTQYHYKAKRDDAYQSIGFKSWFRQDDEKIELTTYYETSTQKTVTQAVKVNELELHRTEPMSINNLKHLTKVLRSPYLYADLIRCSLFDATEIPKMTAEENFGKMDFSLSFKEDVIYPKLEVVSTQGDFLSTDFLATDFKIYTQQIVVNTTPQVPIGKKHSSKFNLKFN